MLTETVMLTWKDTFKIWLLGYKQYDYYVHHSKFLDWFLKVYILRLHFCLCVLFTAVVMQS